MPFLFILLADWFLVLVKTDPDIWGRTLAFGDEKLAMAVADNRQLVSETTEWSLNKCARVIKRFYLISGMLINWLKIVAICSPAPELHLLGELHHVRILQLGEVQKYLGADVGRGWASDI